MLTRLRLIMILLTLAGSGNFLPAQETFSFEEENSFEDFVQKQMREDHIPGLSVGVMKDGKFWAKGYGYTDLENKVPAHRYSVYRLASNTKSMTAAAILKLYEENKISLDEPVHKYVPYYPRKKWESSIRQVLGHIGGISHYKNYEKEGHIKETKNTREAIEIFDDFSLIAKPGTKFHYSSYGYNLLGAIIEEAAEMPYETYLYRNIWGPLQMDHTFMDRPGEIVRNRAEGYRMVFGELKNSEFVNITSRFASGGTCASVMDLLKYAEGINEATILSENSVHLMETPMELSNGLLTDYGMGWRIKPVNGRFMAYHTGGQPETRTLLMRFPEEHMAIAVAYNLEGGSLHAFPRRLYQLIMKEGWNIKPYAGNKHDRALIRGIWNIYNYGLAAYTRDNARYMQDPVKTEKLFSYVNQTLNPDSLYTNFKATRKKIQLGRHPRAHFAYVRVGVYMAAQLASHYGENRLESYHKEGALKFFTDYIQLTENEEEIPHTFNLDLRNKIKRYNQDWKHSWNEDTRLLWLGSYTNLKKQVEEMDALFSNKKFYPDFTHQLANAIWERALKQGWEAALPIAKKFTALYPESAIPEMILAQIYVLEGNKEKAEHALDLALKADVDRHVVSANNLNRYVQMFFNRDFLDESLLLIDVAQNIYPENAALHDSKGDIYLEKSRRQFQKALQIDPTSDDTRNKLMKVD